MNLGDLAGQVLGGMGGGQQQSGGGLAQIALQLLMNQGGGQGSGGGMGLNALLEAFQSNGLGDVVGSWVGTGANQPVSADQIRNVLGGGQLEQLAGQAGLSTEETSSQLADLLPGLVDKLTPNGQVPGQDDLMSTGMGLLQGLLGGGR